MRLLPPNRRLWDTWGRYAAIVSCRRGSDCGAGSRRSQVYICSCLPTCPTTARSGGSAPGHSTSRRRHHTHHKGRMASYSVSGTAAAKSRSPRGHRSGGYDQTRYHDPDAAATPARRAARARCQRGWLYGPWPRRRRANRGRARGVKFSISAFYNIIKLFKHLTQLFSVRVSLSRHNFSSAAAPACAPGKRTTSQLSPRRLARIASSSAKASEYVIFVSFLSVRKVPHYGISWQI